MSKASKPRATAAEKNQRLHTIIFLLRNGSSPKDCMDHGVATWGVSPRRSYEMVEEAIAIVAASYTPYQLQAIGAIQMARYENIMRRAMAAGQFDVALRAADSISNRWLKFAQVSTQGKADGAAQAAPDEEERDF